MGIKRYKATKDNTITNAYDESLTTRGTGSNMGQADILEIFSIYGQATTTSDELSRVLIQFNIDQISTDRSNGSIPASGSVNFFLKLYNAEHSHTLPRDFKITVNAVSGSWQEGRGLDMESYKDITNDKIGSNWVRANETDAAATGKVTVLNEGFIEDNDTITLIATDGTQVVATAHATDNTDEAATTAVTFSHNGASPSAQATLIATAINYSSYFSATANGADVNITQSVSGYGGNRVITCVDGGGAGPWFSKTDFDGGSGKWSSEGGDFYTDTSSSFEQTFSEGTEDLEIDVTDLVEQWLDSSGNVLGSKENEGFLLKLSSSYEAYTSTNTDGALLSYYTKKFFARSSEFFFEQPRIEARWDSSTKDNRANFYLSSSLAPASDNLNTIYLYNYIRGNLTNIPSVGQADPIYVSIFSGSSDNTALSGATLQMSVDDDGFVGSNNQYVVTGGYVSTGIYSASFAFTGSTSLETIYDVWFTGSHTTADASTAITQFHTGSIKILRFEASNINPNSKYVISMPNLKDRYSDKQTERFRLYVRNKDWSPNIYTKAQSTPETLIIESASFQVTRVVDQKIVIPYGTGSSDKDCTMLSYDVSGNYFDLDMKMLEPGYTYGFQYSFYEDSVSSYRQQPYLFKIRVEKDEY